MNGDEAMVAMIHGKKVRLRGWHPQSFQFWRHGGRWYQPGGMAGQVHCGGDISPGDWEMFEPEKGEDMVEMGLFEAIEVARANRGEPVVQLGESRAHWSALLDRFLWSNSGNDVNIASRTLFGWRRVQEEPEAEWLDSVQAEAALRAGKVLQCKGCRTAYRFMRNGVVMMDDGAGLKRPLPLGKSQFYRVIGEEPEPEPEPLRPDVPEGYEAWEVENDSDTLRAVHGLEPVHAVFLTSVPDDPRFAHLYGYEEPDRIVWYGLPGVWRHKTSGRLSAAPQGVRTLAHLQDWAPILPKWVLMVKKA